MTATQITDHAAQAQARLHQQHKGKANIEALLSALVSPSQDIEDAMYQLLTERTIDTAVGEQLNVLGVIVGQPRNGLSDDDYRRHVRARVSVSNSKARVSDLIVVSRLIIGDLGTNIEVDQTGAAAVSVRLTGNVVTDTVAGYLIDFLLDTVAAGVRILLHYNSDVDDDTFTLGSVTVVTNALLPIGATSFFVASTANFPDSGTLLLSKGTSQEETVTYTGKTATQFTGVSPTTQIHTSGNNCQDATDAATKGYDDDAAPGTGGKWSSIIGA